MPPGYGNIGRRPQKLVLIEVRVVGWVLVRTLLRRMAMMVIFSFRPRNFPGRPYPVGERGASTLEGSSISMFSSTSSSTTMSESPCWGPSSAIETSLMLQASICVGDRQGWESPPIEECLSCSSSSSHTQSSHDSGGDWATSITSVADHVRGDSALSDISSR